MKWSLWWWDLFRLLFLRGPTSGLVHMHEDHFLIGCQDGVKLLVTNRGQLCHVPSLTLVHGHMDDPQSALQRWRYETKKKINQKLGTLESV